MKGKLICAGEKIGNLVFKQMYIIGGIILSTSPIIGTLWVISKASSLFVEYVILMIIVEVVGIWILIAGLRLRKQIEIYENGFIPRRVPYKFWFKHKEFFIPWKDIVWVNYIPTTSLSGKEMWMFVLATKDEKTFSICFKDIAPNKRLEILMMLKSLEKEVKSKNQRPKKILLYDM